MSSGNYGYTSQVGSRASRAFNRCGVVLVPTYVCSLGLTVCALTGGMYSLMSNNKKQSQMMMRARVFFQFCTISALVGGERESLFTSGVHAEPLSLSRAWLGRGRCTPCCGWRRYEARLVVECIDATL